MFSSSARGAQTGAAAELHAFCYGGFHPVLFSPLPLFDGVYVYVMSKCTHSDLW